MVCLQCQNNQTIRQRMRMSRFPLIYVCSVLVDIRMLVTLSRYAPAVITSNSLQIKRSADARRLLDLRSQAVGRALHHYVPNPFRHRMAVKERDLRAVREEALASRGADEKQQYGSVKSSWRFPAGGGRTYPFWHFSPVVPGSSGLSV